MWRWLIQVSWFSAGKYKILIIISIFLIVEVIKLIGCGGAGSRFASYIAQEIGVDILRINDKHGDLNVDGRLIKAYEDVSSRLISQAFPWINRLSSPYLFVVAGLGGGVGTGAAKLIGKARKGKSKLIGIFTLPFSSENKERRIRAEEAVKDIERYYDMYFVLDNDGLVKHYSHVPINVAMSISAEVMKHIVLDFKRIFLKNLINVNVSGELGVGIGMGVGKERIRVAIEDALDSPWIKGEKKIMLFSGDIELEDVEPVTKYYDPVFVDVYRTKEYGERVKVTILTKE